MSPRHLVDFYYAIGSRYSYLASTQIPQLERETRARVRWHPVHGPDIRKLRGGDPFAGEPLSGQYEWPYRRYDAECWADYYGVPFREPRDPHFDYRLLVKAATAAKRMGAVVPYSQALFRAVWVESVWPLDEDVCRQAAASVGLSSSEFGEVLLSNRRPTTSFGVPRQKLTAGGPSVYRPCSWATGCSGETTGSCSSVTFS